MPQKSANSILPLSAKKKKKKKKKNIDKMKQMVIARFVGNLCKPSLLQLTIYVQTVHSHDNEMDTMAEVNPINRRLLHTRLFVCQWRFHRLMAVDRRLLTAAR